MRAFQAIAVAAAVVGLAACGNAPVARVPTNNPDIKVDKLFTIDGCTVYRFGDGHSVYFAKCDAKGAGVQSTYDDCYWNAAIKTEQCDTIDAFTVSA